MNRYTPGPWMLTKDGFPELNNQNNVIYGADLVAIVYGQVNDYDARLISACPDMFEALKAIIPFIPKTSESDGGAAKYSENVKAADMVRAAISKATGQ